jgi:hypothetical protein
MDDDDDDDDDILLTTDVNLEKFNIDQTTDEDNDNHIEKMDELENNLNEKLVIEENTTKSIVVE